MDGRVNGQAGLGLVAGRRRDNVHLVSASEKLLGKMGDVLGDAAGIREIVRRDEGKLHCLPLLTRASASERRSIAPDGWRHSTPGVRPQPELAPTRPAACRLYARRAPAAHWFRPSARPVCVS